ncbi:39S ribosomal protein L48, mitochondrial [Cheilinus undulatus]|uniref:39S ribosomal protein L48, mitochondrial n=1 Tax=Cheilinus undulatus TaxID=241271 RepID=UPI001BD4B277|nr:39S ribosomal protein L48, mitochondrial [Cheilinus undulatus]
MNPVFRKLQMSVAQQARVVNQALTLCRATPCIQHPVWASVTKREHRSMPTHGIGRWRHLLAKGPAKKRKERLKMKPILPATDSAYGSLNFTMSGYDMTLVEHYSQYIHNLCNRLGIKVSESYALPTKSTEVMLMLDQSTKMTVEAVLKTHLRVIQVSSLETTLCPVFMEVLLKNQPEGVQLSVIEHTEAEFEARFKKRPELEGLLSQMNQ